MRSLEITRDLRSLSLAEIASLAIDLRTQRETSIKLSAKTRRKAKKKSKLSIQIDVDGSVVSYKPKREPRAKKPPAQDVVELMQSAGIEMTPEMQEQLKILMTPKPRKARKKKDATS